MRPTPGPGMWKPPPIMRKSPWGWSYHRSSGLVANIPLRSVVYRTRLGGWLRTLLMRPTAASSAAGPPLDGGGVGYGTLFGRSEHRHTRIEHNPGRNIPVEVPTVRAAAAGKVPR